MTERTTTAKWLSGLLALVGAWLIISPFVLGISSTTGMWNTIIIGAVALVLGIYQFSAPAQSWASWVTLLAAIWLIVFPYMFNPPEVAAYNNAVWSAIILGVLAISDALAASALAHDDGSMTHRTM